MTEKEFGRLFLKHNRMTGAFELKLTKTGRFSFKTIIKQHQLDAIRSACLNAFKEDNDEAVVGYKIPDMPISRMQGGRNTRFIGKKPYDIIVPHVGFYVLGFYVPKEPWKVVYLLPTNMVVLEDEMSRQGRASFKYDDVLKYATRIDHWTEKTCVTKLFNRGEVNPS